MRSDIPGRRGIGLAVAALALIGSTGVRAQELDGAQVRRIDSVFAGFDHTDRPGCSLGIARGGRLVYHRGYGMANLEYGLALTPASIFHVASISKQFTAFSIGLLAERGKLSLDDEVRKFIPELPDYGHRITLRHLIYHTSGIRDQWELLRWAGWREDDPITEGDILEIVTRQRALNFTPGDEYLYSNSGYTLLAIIVKRVSGQSLREFADANIFKPLAMRDTHFHDDHSMIVPNRTSAYERRTDGSWRISIPVFDNDGATSLFTTVGDLLKWEQNFADMKVGGPALFQDAQTTARTNDGKPTDYGFGLSLETFRGVRGVGHGGADAGFRADVVRFPEHGLGLAVLCNFGEAVPGQYARQVAAVLLEGKLAPAAAGLAPAVVKLTPEQLGQVAGVYKSPRSDDAWRLVVKDGQLVLTNFGVPLTALGPRKFTAFGATVDFESPADSGPMRVKVSQGEQVIFEFTKVAPFLPVATALTSFAGEYWSDEIGATYTVLLKDSTLVLRRRKFEDIDLAPLFADAFSGPATIRFTRSSGRVTGFRLSGGRVRGVAFVRVEPTKPRR